MATVYQVSEHFDAREFVDPITFKEKGIESLDLIKPNLIKIAEYYRTGLGVSIVINNWHIGGQYRESCYRRSDSKIGAKYSMHKEGKAADLKGAGLTPKDFYNFTIAHKQELFDLGLRRIEDIKITPTWFHVDLKEHGIPNTILVVDLTKVSGRF